MWRLIGALRRRAEREYDRDVRLAWLVAYVHFRAATDRRMPNLETLLTRKREPVQTAAEHKVIFRILADMYGGTLTPGKGKRAGHDGASKRGAPKTSG